jgi:hypothetical protein
LTAPEQKHCKNCRRDLLYDFRHIAIDAQINSKRRPPVSSSAREHLNAP